MGGDGRRFSLSALHFMGMARGPARAYPAAMAISMWLCCFCGKEIEETERDPCAVRVTTAEDNDQAWACHGACFKERLAIDPPIFEPAFF
jgi:hypothetical protein